MGDPVKLSTISDVLKNHKTLTQVRVIGRVVNKFLNQEKTYGNVVLDDETETIRVKFFSDSLGMLSKIQLGDFVEVFGRVGSFEEEIHIVADTIRISTNLNQELLRKLQLIKTKDNTLEVLKAIKAGNWSFEGLVGEFGEGVREKLKILMEKGEIYEKEPKKYAPVE